MTRAIFLTLAILAAVGSAGASEPVPCWQVKAVRAWAGSDSAAEKLAIKHGYTREQIAEARKRCLR